MSSNMDESTNQKIIRMGYWISEKKSKKLNIEEFTDFCRNAGVELVKLNLDEPIAEQGPFELIFHKLTDILAKANLGNERARQQILRFQEYTAAHPEVAIVDPLDNLRKLMDRHEQYRFVRDCQVVETDYGYFMPSFVEFMSTDIETNKQLMMQYGVQFPFICKPSVAHGSTQCHQMAVIFNEAGLQDVSPPCVAQTFINHNAVLYKIFIIGNQHFVVPRPSLKNFAAGDHKTIHFDSACISKPYSHSVLNMLDEGDEEMEQHVLPDMDRLHHLSRAIQERFGLDLLGVDVIIENNTGRYAVIDINAFPGYENGIDCLHQRLLNVFLDKLHQHSTSQGIPSQGFPSGDNQNGIFHFSFQNQGHSPEHKPKRTPSGNLTPNNDKSTNDTSSISINSSEDKERLLKSEANEPLTDDNCNLDEIPKDKEKDPVIFCNHMNSPRDLANETCTTQGTIIWDQIPKTDSSDSTSLLSNTDHNRDIK